MQLSQIGEIAQKFWVAIPSHFNHVRIDEYAFMPNHMHGIVIIDRPHLETGSFASLQADKSNKFAPLKPGSLQSIIQAYKSAVTRWCRKNEQDYFNWQSRFYEHIIRADGSVDRIRQYIIDNPAKWKDDQDNPSNLWM